MPIEQRFWAKVKKTRGCWIWTAAKNPGGYGVIGKGGRGRGYYIASRLSYTWHCGAIPRGMFVCHKCDNPACVRPDHLFVGNQLDNMRDAAAKGRVANGRKLPQTKLTASKVRAIRKSYLRVGQIAKLYEMSTAQISRIRSRQYWTHVP